MTPEKKTLPQLGQILESYGIILPDNTNKIELENEWDKRKDEVLQARSDDIIRFLNQAKGEIGESEFPSTPPLTLKTQKWSCSEQQWIRFVIDLENENRSITGRFWLSRNNEQPNVWWFDHRDTRPEYRGNGLGNAISESVDAMIQELANKSGQEQVITCEVEQIDVLLWFLKNGYTAHDEKSQKLIDEILNDDGSENFELSSHPNGGMELCIFKKGKSDWDGIKNIHQLKERGEVITIQLVKKFYPKTPPSQTGIRKKLSRLLNRLGI